MSDMRVRAAVGRADLLRLIAELGDSQAEACAALVGLVWQPPLPSAPEPSRRDVRSPADAEPAPSELGAAEPLKASLAAVIEATTEVPEDSMALLDDLHDVQAPRFDQLLLKRCATHEPPLQSLSPARRLASFARRLLRYPQATRHLDVAQWIRAIANGRPPRRLPTQSRLAWGRAGGMVWLASPGMQPYARDCRDLCAKVNHWSGAQAPVFLRAADGQWYRFNGRLRKAISPWMVARPFEWRHLERTCVLAWPQSDAAVIPGLSPPDSRHLTLLKPRAAPDGGLRLPPGAQAVQWDRGYPLKPHRTRPASCGDANEHAHDQRLLAALTLTVRCEPTLLRALRLLLGLPAGVEGSVWTHDSVQAGLLGLELRPDHTAHLRGALMEETPSLRRALADLVRAHHEGLSKLVQMEEHGFAAQLATAQATQATADGRPDWMNAARTLVQDPFSDEAAAVQRHVRRAARRAQAADWLEVPGLAETYVLANEELIRLGEALPPPLPAETVGRVLASRQGKLASQERVWHLIQQGAELVLIRTDIPPKQPSLAAIRAKDGVVLERTEVSQWVRLNEDRVVLGARWEGECWTLRSERSKLTIADAPRPAWAAEFGRDRRGLYVMAPALGSLQARFDWVASARSPEPFPGPAVFRFRGGASSLQAITVDDAEWRIGVDEPYGPFADLQVKGAVQRFRYLPPGEFWMGSPQDESERRSHEGPRHRVRLTHGLWLADTACTQALWLAVMGGKNPSRFAEDLSNPVEQVSWNDVQTFLQRIRPLLPPGTEAVLPTEAQWEYACRAGTDSPFAFGVNVRPDQVNYDGNYPYGLGAKGLFRRQTVLVKSLPPNDWGLYEMHGNVWEWCADAQRPYEGAELIEDPRGPAEPGLEAHRAVRGGSWIGYAWSVRSAYRNANPRDDRYDSLGFRLALRSSSTSPEGAERPAPEAPPVLAPGPEGVGPAARRDAGPPRRKAAPKK